MAFRKMALTVSLHDINVQLNIHRKYCSYKWRDQILFGNSMDYVSTFNYTNFLRLSMYSMY